MHWETIEVLFEAALALDEKHRHDYLASACEGRPELLEEILAMLAVQLSPLRIEEDLLLSVDAEERGDPLIGTTIAHYRLTERIGQGGMGVVYRAVRDSPYRQTVALKLVHLLTSSAHVRRFQRERQILARLQHPGIGRLLDGGFAEGNRPYLVMELVEGQPLTDHCASRNLGLADRLALFRQACEAVQYAHQQLVVHRDIKPSNISVTADGRVKLLDFGIAKLLESDESDDATMILGRAHTPAYASPEQLKGEDISTSTDVFSLGVMLYELLTDTRPFADRPELPTSRDVLPRPPSEATKTDAGSLRAIRGDLDTIVLKTLQPDPARRYASASHLIEDIDRYLAGQPISARDDSALYRVRMFVRRHRVGVTLVGTGVLVLLASALFAFSQALTAAHQRDIARAQKARADQVVELLISLFETANPSVVPGGDTLRVAEFVSRGAAQILEGVKGDPELEIEVKHVISRLYSARSRYEEARALVTEALEAREQMYGPADTVAATLLSDLALLTARMGDENEARRLFTESLEREQRTFGRQHRRVAYSMQNLAMVTPDKDEQLRLLLEAREIRRALLPPVHIEHADGLNALANYYLAREECEEAIPLYRESLAILELLKSGAHPNVLRVRNNLAVCLSTTGDLDGAVEMYREIIARAEDVLGQSSTQLGNAWNNSGVALTRRGDFEQAEQSFRRALDILEAGFGPVHPRVANTKRNLGMILHMLGRDDEAVEHLRSAVADFVQLRGADNPGVAYARAQLGMVLHYGARTDEALRLSREAVALLEENAEGSYLADGMLWWATILHADGQARAALPYAERSLSVRRQLYPDGDGRIPEALCTIAGIVADLGQDEKALELLKECLPAYSAWPQANPRRVTEFKAHRDALRAQP